MPGDLLQPGRTRKVSVVYYLQRDDRAVKIGRSVILPQRRDQLERRYGSLTLLAWEPGGRILEQDRHAEFAASRLEGEWFRKSRDLSVHIRLIRAELEETQRHFGPRLAEVIGAAWV
jgi:hypothetical protein